MCGIAGFVDDQLTRDEAAKQIERMLESISHRGPDARATYFDKPLMLGHNRLSILDLSVNGNQPMEYFDSVIIFNAEIYNYIEIREELKAKGYVFNTGTDTEVVLAAYREYGTDCVKKFVGMWSFALWDKMKQQLFCSRDRFGIKPFYYIQEGSRFYFGSEYKALKQSPIFSNDLNLDQVSRGLQLGWICYDDETYYSKLKSLPAACNLIYKNGKIEVQKYWELNSSSENMNLSMEDAKDKFYSLLNNSVSISMRSDVEIAICLSGGIDSSALSALISNQFKSQDFRSFSIYYDGKNEVNEKPFMQAVTDRYQNIKPNYYKPSPNDILERFDKIMYQVDAPALGSSNFSHYYLLEQIRKENVKVVVDGQGADEYLAGYMHSMYRFNSDLISNFRIGNFISNIAKSGKFQNQNIKELVGVLGKTALSTVFSEQNLYAYEYNNYYPFVMNGIKSKVPFRLEDTHKNSLNNFLHHLLFTTSLPTILHYVDRMTMAHSVESRVPLLDHRLVEFAFTINNDFKIKDGVTKKILRESVKEFLPEKIYNRRDKKGFVTPGEEVWLRNSLKHLLDVDYERMDFLKKDLVKRLIEEYRRGSNKNSKLIWRIATLNYWLKNFN